MEEEKLERSIRKSEIPGLTREEEEAQLAKVIGIAEQNLEQAKADIRLANAQGGKCLVVFSGPQHDVEAALAAGGAAAEEMQGLIRRVIVERPHECLARFLES